MLDDAQWAEADAPRADRERGASHGIVPILLLCVGRPELLERRPDWGQSAGAGSTTVKLEPLDEAACDRLIAELLGEAQSALDVRDRVAGRRKAIRCSSSR